MRLYFAGEGSLIARSPGGHMGVGNGQDQTKDRSNKQQIWDTLLPCPSTAIVTFVNFCWCSCMLGFLVGGWIEDGSCSILKISKIRTEDTLDLF